MGCESEEFWRIVIFSSVFWLFALLGWTVLFEKLYLRKKALSASKHTADPTEALPTASNHIRLIRHGSDADLIGSASRLQSPVGGYDEALVTQIEQQIAHDQLQAHSPLNTHNVQNVHNALPHQRQPTVQTRLSLVNNSILAPSNIADGRISHLRAPLNPSQANVLSAGAGAAGAGAGAHVQSGPERLITPLEEIPFVYNSDLDSLQRKRSGTVETGGSGGVTPQNLDTPVTEIAADTTGHTEHTGPADVAQVASHPSGQANHTLSLGPQMIAPSAQSNMNLYDNNSVEVAIATDRDRALKQNMLEQRNSVRDDTEARVSKLQLQVHAARTAGTMTDQEMLMIQNYLMSTTSMRGSARASSIMEMTRNPSNYSNASGAGGLGGLGGGGAVGAAGPAGARSSNLRVLGGNNNTSLRHVGNASNMGNFGMQGLDTNAYARVRGAQSMQLPAGIGAGAGARGGARVSMNAAMGAGAMQRVGSLRGNEEVRVSLAPTQPGRLGLRLVGNVSNSTQLVASMAQGDSGKSNATSVDDVVEMLPFVPEESDNAGLMMMQQVPMIGDTNERDSVPRMSLNNGSSVVV